MSAEVSKARSNVTFAPKDSDEIVSGDCVCVCVCVCCTYVGCLGDGEKRERWAGPESFPSNLGETPFRF